ncbi:MAG: hypothetical protein ACYSUX_03930, partial [Planctomycetota bacterium]
TRSDEYVVRAGYTALAATISAETWQTKDNPVELIIRTQSLDSEPEPAEGTVQIYTLKQPAKVIRPKMGYSGRQPDPSNPETWEPADLVSEQAFQTDALGQAILSVALEAGIYRALLQTQDRFGKSVAAQHTIHVVDPQAEHFNVRVANHFAAPAWSLEGAQDMIPDRLMWNWNAGVRSCAHGGPIPTEPRRSSNNKLPKICEADSRYASRMFEKTVRI